MESAVSVVLFYTSFNVLSSYFYDCLNLTGILQLTNLSELRDTAPLSGQSASQMLEIMIQSNAVNTDTDGSIESDFEKI